MNKPKTLAKQDPLLTAIGILKATNSEFSEYSDYKGVVDIITFCDSPLYLDLLNPKNRFNLYMSQRVILKCFYMGDVGNENMKLTKEEWAWLYSKEEWEVLDGETYENNIKDVIKKMLNREKDKTMNKFSTLQLVLGRRASKCRSNTDLIATTAGSITFEDLLKRINNKEKIGICTYDQEKWKKSITYDLKAADNGVVDCYTVKTIRGIKETSSHNHPYLVWRNDWEKPRFLPMTELIAGDKIAVANCTHLFGKGGIGVKKAALLGHLQGDGGTAHYVGYSTACNKMLADITHLVESEFPDHKVKHVAKYDYNIIKSSGRNMQNGTNKNMVKEWLKEQGCFGKKAIHKEVPKSILEGSKDEVSAFLSRLFGCDGWVTVRMCKGRNHPKCDIGYCSSSEKLADGVRHLLQKFGIHAVIKHHIARFDGKSFDTWRVCVSRKEDIETFHKEIDIFSKEDRVAAAVSKCSALSNSNSEFNGIPMGVWTYIKNNVLAKGVTQQSLTGEDGATSNKRLRMQYMPNREKVSEYGKFGGDEWLIGMGTSDIRWDEIESVTFTGKIGTVALEVGGTNIIGGDIVSHNTIMASIITAYEAYKLLTINNGNAHEYYNCPAGDEISIINVALSQEQAGILFGQIAARLRDSPFFQNRVGSQSASEIRLLTNQDLERIKKKSAIKTPGSIVLMCGHSNPDSLAGRSAILILFDEIAFYDESGKVTGTYFYSRLKPSLSKFYEKGDGKVVMISSPNKQNGIFWETFKRSKEEESTLSFQLPTWSVNDGVGYDLEETQKDRRANIERFMIEYGAQWAMGGDFGNLFPAELIDRCVRHDIQPHVRPSNKFNYYLHVDPANGGNNYVAVLVAKEKYTNNFGKKRWRCHLANLWIWRPLPKLGLQYHMIDKHVIQICHTFRPNLVTYDAYNSTQSMQLLRSHGINTKCVPFSRTTKQKIYQNLNDLMVYEPMPELCLYSDGGDADLLITELKGLRKKRTQRGFGIIPDKHGDVNTDDLADALAGACAMACDGLQMGLPAPVTVLSGLR